MQASIPPVPPALICTIQAVQSSWLKTPIQAVRQLEYQSFRVIHAPDSTEKQNAERKVKVEPRTVIDSRLTILAENFQSLERWQPRAMGYGQLNYTWSFKAPLGFVAKPHPGKTSNTMNTTTIHVEGSLKINPQLQFELYNLSTLRQDTSSDLINRLDEQAKGSCIHQSRS